MDDGSLILTGEHAKTIASAAKIQGAESAAVRGEKHQERTEDEHPG